MGVSDDCSAPRSYSSVWGGGIRALTVVALPPTSLFFLYSPSFPPNLFPSLPPFSSPRSICNEVLCNTNSDKTTAVAMKDLFHDLDPLGNRPVSANQNGWVGPDTPLDVQGFDYSTGTWGRVMIMPFE